MDRWLPVLLCLTLPMLGLTACGDEKTGWQDVAAANLTDAQQFQLDRALEARDSMFEQLSGRLKAAVAAGGGVGAITVCRDEAPRVATEVSTSKGLEIGRTSHRLRNPANRTPAWAQALVEARAEQPRYRHHTDGRLGVLLPIRTAKRCLGCHGAKEAMPPALATALAEHYPDDAATGFTEGELRGWFWIEVPAKEAP